MSTTKAYLDNSNLVRITGLANDATGAYINGGVTVTADIVPQGGTTVVTDGGPISLSYVAASDGIWQGVFSDNLVIVDGERYTCRVTADGGEFLTGHWELPLLAKVRVP
jgi:hypothetical protein